MYIKEILCKLLIIQNHEIILKTIFDDVDHNSDEVIISLDRFNAMNETDYLLYSSKNRERLLNSIQVQAGRLLRNES